MRRMSSFLAIILVLVISVSIFILPVSAATISEVNNFPEVYYGCTHYGYTKAAQKFFWCLSPSISARIEASGGIDGVFGQTTYTIAKEYQTSRGLTSDGSVGPRTWNQIASDLVYAGMDSLGNCYKCEDRLCWIRASYQGRPAFFIFDENERIPSTPFHMV